MITLSRITVILRKCQNITAITVLYFKITVLSSGYLKNISNYFTKSVLKSMPGKIGGISLVFIEFILSNQLPDFLMPKQKKPKYFSSVVMQRGYFKELNELKETHYEIQ